MAEILVVFGLLLALGLSWMGVMPLWQGADEPAYFACVQYMGDHVLPPAEQVVAPGQHPWAFSASSPSRRLTAIACWPAPRVGCRPRPAGPRGQPGQLCGWRGWGGESERSGDISAPVTRGVVAPHPKGV